MARCRKCSGELSEGEKFCSRCGTSREALVLQNGQSLLRINVNSEPSRFFLDIPPGETLYNKKFSIQSRIGSGVFGEVYLAIDQNANYPVALKIVPKVEGEKETGTLQLFNERKHRRNIQNFEHIIKVNDDYVDSDYKGLTLVLLSMEYADGGNLRKWITDNRVSIKQADKRSEALRYFKEACLGVKTIHDADLVHLNLKPENLLILRGRVKVSDLIGLSRNYIQYAQNQDMFVKEHANLPYMSLEQYKSARSKEITHLSDIYSLGIILFELLDGDTPFEGRTFDEFKEKHLTYKPTSLKNVLAPWGMIVDRCLKKEPSKRYQSVDDLLADLDRADKGDILSVAAACPNCAHINENKDLKKCQKCGEDISHLFRHCPNCRRLNRLDLAVCPSENLGCGFEIGRYFRIEDLLRKAHRFKDVDPLEAIRNLVEVLNLDRGNAEAKDMLPALRELQEQIDGIVPEADKAQKEGRLEDARTRWQDVLSLAPRHLVATKKKNELDDLIERYNANYERASVLMDQGEFLKAREILDECSKLIPRRKETEEALRNLNKREKPFNQHFEKARSLRRRKSLDAARIEFELCLVEAPKAEKILKPNAEVEKDIFEADALFSEAKEMLEAADFEGTRRNIDHVLEIQRDLSGFQRFVKEFRDKEKKYCELSSKWTKSLQPEIRDLNKAQRNLEEAVKIWPEHSEIRELLDQVSVDKERARQLIMSAKSSIRAAAFTKGKNQLVQAECVWRKVPTISRTIEQLDTTERSYNKHIEAARDLYEEKKDLDSPLDEAEEALKICPDSTEAKTLKKRIDSDRNRVIELLYEVTSLIPKADFDNASKYIEEAESIWPNLTELHRVKNVLNDKKKTYSEYFKRATDSCEKKDLDSALGDARNAVNVCTQSHEAKVLLDRIVSNRKKALSLIERIQSAILSAEFSNASKHIEEAENVWPNVKGIEQSKNDLNRKRKEYSGFFKRATDSYRKRDLDSALKETKQALSICRKSRDAETLYRNIVNNQERAVDLIKNVRALSNSAGFVLANMNIKNAESIWPNAPDLSKVKRILETKKKGYDAFYHEAKRLFRREKKLGVALKNVRFALRVCPESREAKILETEVLSIIARKSELRRRFRDRILIPLSIVGGVPIYWFIGPEILRTVFPSIFKYQFFFIALGINTYVFIVTSILLAIGYNDPYETKQNRRDQLLLFWVSWGLSSIIPCLVFRYVFRMTWITGASVGLTFSGVMALAPVVLMIWFALCDFE